MKFLILSFFYFSITFSWSQIIFPEKINNTKTAAHQNIQRSRVFVVFPEDFKNDDLAVGIKNSDGNVGVVVYDLIGGSFYSNARNVTRENFESKGLIVSEFYEFIFNNYPAKFVTLIGNGTKSYQLIFGDSTFSVSLMSVFPPEDIAIGEIIRKCILSATYDTSFIIDHKSLAPFTIDESKTKFKFFNYSGGMYIYIEEGASEDDPNASGIMLMLLPNIGAEDVLNQQLMEINHYYKEGVVLTKKQQKLIVNGCEAFETENYSSGGNSRLFYLVVVTKGEKAILMTGQAVKNQSENLEIFKKLARTIQIK